MIVDPDFVDHWKTRMLADLLGEDEFAPLYVIRLWAHCQQRREWVFDLPPAALKAICRFKGDADMFESAMVASGFVSRSGDKITVEGWEKYNASLIANWKNGQRGGRPKKSKDSSSKIDQETHGFSIGNPHDSHGEAIRGDKIREDIEANASVDSDASAPTVGLFVQSSKTLPPCPVERIVNAYHELLPDNPRVKVLNNARRRLIASRWREAARLKCSPFGYTSTEEGIEAWRAFFSVCADSDFLTGRSKPQPGKPPFVADIDFLMSPSGFAKCLENKYHWEAA